jgi:hypothetical protein
MDLPVDPDLLICTLQHRIDELTKANERLQRYVADLERCNWYDMTNDILNLPSVDEAIATPTQDSPELYVFNAERDSAEFRPPRTPSILDEIARTNKAKMRDWPIPKFMTMYVKKED